MIFKSTKSNWYVDYRLTSRKVKVKVWVKGQPNEVVATLNENFATQPELIAIGTLMANSRKLLEAACAVCEKADQGEQTTEIITLKKAVNAALGKENLI